MGGMSRLPRCVLRLVTKPNCSLCRDARIAVKSASVALSEIVDLSIEEMEIDPTQPATRRFNFEKHKDQIPILTVSAPAAPDSPSPSATVAWGRITEDEVTEKVGFLFDPARPAADGDFLRVPRVAGLRSTRIVPEPGRVYWWCVCGFSAEQPWCDGSHTEVNELFGTSFAPTQWVPRADEDGTLPATCAMCTCKRTAKPPICDGAHKSIPVPKV